MLVYTCIGIYSYVSVYRLNYLQCVTVCSNVLHCGYVNVGIGCIMCSVLQCVAVRCNVLQYGYVNVCIGCIMCSVLQCVAVCCSVLQCVALWVCKRRYRLNHLHAKSLNSFSHTFIFFFCAYLFTSM